MLLNFSLYLRDHTVTTRVSLWHCRKSKSVRERERAITFLRLFNHDTESRKLAGFLFWEQSTLGKIEEDVMKKSSHLERCRDSVDRWRPTHCKWLHQTRWRSECSPRCAPRHEPPTGGGGRMKKRDYLRYLRYNENLTQSTTPSFQRIPPRCGPTFWWSTAALEVISPKIITIPVLMHVSHATLASGSTRK